MNRAPRPHNQGLDCKDMVKDTASAQQCSRRFVKGSGVKCHVLDCLARRCVVDHVVIECRLLIEGIKKGREQGDMEER